MRTVTGLVLLLVSLLLAQVALARPQPLQTWDGLPAFDPMHLAGAYAGRRVCPMCAHGYDAGIVLFIPSTTLVAEVEALIAPLRSLRDELPSPRYRVFVVLTGAAPSPEFVEAVSETHAQWYVASLSGSELAAAERDFAATLVAAPVAYAFSQRRLLRHYDASELLDRDNSVADDARYALELLGRLHPDDVAADADHDVPRGALWFAPSRLHASLKLTDAPAAAACFFDDAGRPLANALLLLESVENSASKPRWERSDTHGCLQLAAPPGRHRVTLHPIGRAPLQRELLRIDAQDTPPVLGRCDGCDAVYDGRPLHLVSQARIGTNAEPGEPMQLYGQVYAPDGQPAAGIQIYAYQTDHAGVYPPLDGLGPVARRHGRLRAWVASDSTGRYRFDTIRPGGYPDSPILQHIHLHVIEADRCTYYLDDVEFADDPRRSDHAERASPRGGSGLSHPERGTDGVWKVRRDIHLGRNVVDYGQCGGPGSTAAVAE